MLRLDSAASIEEYERFCRGHLPDPYPLFQRLQAEDPVHWSDLLGAWVITRYSGVVAGLRSMAPLAAISWAARLGWMHLENTWLAFLGFAPTPYDSGTSLREQGISGAGNARLQAISIQLAWNWVRWQPQSALTQWYQTNFGKGKRARRIGIVAVARKLVIALWRYVTTGVVPAGAILKGA